MNCNQARALFSSAIDNEANDAARTPFDLHLAGCRSCRDLFAAEIGADRLIAERLGAARLPDETWARIESAVRAARRRTWPLRLGLVGAAAAILLVSWQLMIHFGSGPDLSRAALVSQQPGGEIIQAFVNATRDPSQFTSSAARELPYRDVALDLSLEATQRHPVELLGMREKPGSEGAILEVLLNCCGLPVLMHIVRKSDPAGLAEVVAALVGDSRLAYREHGVNVAATSVGDYVVVAASRHSVTPLLGAVTKR